MKIAGIDPALRNTGIAIAEFDSAKAKLIITDLYLVSTTPEINTMQGEDTLRRCKEIYKKVMEHTKDCELVVAEIPTGGSNNKTAFALGAGFTAALVGLPQPLITVSPYEVKNAALPDYPAKLRNKAAMVAWAIEKHPEAPWPAYPFQGKFNPIKNIDYIEHLADAIASIYAGLEKVMKK